MCGGVVEGTTLRSRKVTPSMWKKGRPLYSLVEPVGSRHSGRSANQAKHAELDCAPRAIFGRSIGFRRLLASQPAARVSNISRCSSQERWIDEPTAHSACAVLSSISMATLRDLADGSCGCWRLGECIRSEEVQPRNEEGRRTRGCRRERKRQPSSVYEQPRRAHATQRGNYEEHVELAVAAGHERVPKRPKGAAARERWPSAGRSRAGRLLCNVAACI